MSFGERAKEREAQRIGVGRAASVGSVRGGSVPGRKAPFELEESVLELEKDGLALVIGAFVRAIHFMEEVLDGECHLAELLPKLLHLLSQLLHVLFILLDVTREGHELRGELDDLTEHGRSGSRR
jgi:hypothetical protein